MAEGTDFSRIISLHLPPRIEVGTDAAARVGPFLEGLERVLVIASRSTAGMVGRLGLAAAPTVFAAIPPEPKDTDLEAALAAAREVRPQAVIGLGGGSVMDVAKLVAVLWDSEQRLADVAGPGRVAKKSARLVQVATTAGTGSEGGIRALVTSTETGMKVAVESPLMLADLAVLDPALTMSMPAPLTAATGIDALAHSVEAFTSLKSHPLVDDYAMMGARLVGRHLPRAAADGTDADARTGMLLASFYGGLCLGPVNTAAGHALAYPLGTRAGLPHGLSVALLFPHVLAHNAPARPEKTRAVLAALGLPESDDPETVRRSVREWCEELELAMSLAAHGVGPRDFASWAPEAHGIRRLMDNNPREMSVAEVEAIYRAAA